MIIIDSWEGYNGGQSTLYCKISNEKDSNDIGKIELGTEGRLREIQRVLEQVKEEQRKSRLQLLKTTTVLLPTDSQWYQLNQLRIHAGAPERSEEGIERLFK